LPARGRIEYIGGKDGKAYKAIKSSKHALGERKQLIGGREMERDLEVLIGDKRIATNEFAKQIIVSTLTGLLKPLKHVDTDEKIQITIGALKG
jgi:hypothetical protein